MTMQVPFINDNPQFPACTAGRTYKNRARSNIIILLAIVFLWSISGCRQATKEEVTPNSDIYYTCSMHPNVIAAKPGNCPICGMKLIAASKSQTQKPDEIQLSDAQISLGNIRVDTLRDSIVEDKTVLTATLTIDQQTTAANSTRIDGRIEKLYFKNSGDYVHKGDKLFDLYSEELNTGKQEYINALQNQRIAGNTLIDYSQLAQNAKNKLLLWGMSASDIRNLENKTAAGPLTSFYSAASGTITSLAVKEGDYVPEGTTIMELADLSTLWAEAQVYSSDFATMKSEGTAVVRVPDLNNLEIKGRIGFVNPEINPNTRINLVRITIPNPGNQLRPGMAAYVYINNSRHNGLTLPSDAVLRGESGESVWIKTGDHAFKVKMVRTGLEDNNMVEIVSGLQTGDVVVVSGTYLLNSEYIFKRGASPMAGMDMSNMKM
jgi:membrane fusion protein, copper/silver efflux system